MQTVAALTAARFVNFVTRSLTTIKVLSRIVKVSVTGQSGKYRVRYPGSILPRDTSYGCRVL
jgi:hypothetical protein